MSDSHDDTQTPYIDHVVMASPTLLQDLGGNIVRSAAECGPSDGVHVVTSHQEGSQSEVADFRVHVPVKKNIAHLQITVDDALSMHVFNGTGNLHSVKAYFGFCQTLPPLYHLHQRSVRAELEGEVCAVVERKGAVELNDVMLSHFRVYLELGLELIGTG